MSTGKLSNVGVNFQVLGHTFMLANENEFVCYFHLLYTCLYSIVVGHYFPFWGQTRMCWVKPECVGANQNVSGQTRMSLGKPEELGAKQNDLGQTRMTLGQTRKTLEQTRMNLEQTRMTLEQTRMTLGQTRMALGQTRMVLGQTRMISFTFIFRRLV